METGPPPIDRVMLRDRLGNPLTLGMVAAAQALLFTIIWIAGIPQPTPEYFPPDERHAFVSTFDPPTSPIEVTANSGDGQSFAALAMDPSLARPEAFYQGPSEAAYRAQRPLAGYAAWALSLGQPGAVLYMLSLISVLGTGLFVYTAALLAQRLGRDPRLALLLVVAPGVVADLRWFCPDVLAAALGLAGLLLWLRRPGRPWAAVACFTLATLTRETLLVIPFVIGVDALLQRVPLRRLLPLAVAPAVLLAWIAVVHSRYGAWPVDAAGQSRVGLPFVGWVQGLSHASTLTIGTFVASAALVVLAWVRCPDRLIRGLILGHLALASVMGESVWEIWFGFGRLMLPVLAIALAAASPPAESTATDPLMTDDTDSRSVPAPA